MTVQDFIDITKSLNKNKPVYALVDYLYEDGEGDTGWFPITNAKKLKNTIGLCSKAPSRGQLGMAAFIQKTGIKLKDLISNLNTIQDKNVELMLTAKLANNKYVAIEKVEEYNFIGTDGIAIFSGFVNIK